MRKSALLLMVLMAVFIGRGFGQCSASITGPTGIVCTGDQVTLTAGINAPSPGNCSQSVNISNTTTTVTCGQSICFYDSGGQSGNYSTSESYVHTFTSANGNPVTITFLTATGETCCDYIYVYDGAGTGGTQLHYGLLSTVNGNVTYTSTGNSLTVKFTSDGSVCYAGWEAVVSCDACENYTYTWSTGATTPTITVAPTVHTVYTVTVQSGDCCNTTASYEVNPVNCVNTCNGFENISDRAEWTLVNGSQTNQWVMGTGTNNGGSYSLYVSNSPTASVPTNAYTNTTSYVWAYRDIEFPECDDDYVLSFDWKCGGESSCDYMAMWIGPEATVTAGSMTAPAGAVAIRNPLQTSTSYQTYFNTYSSYNGDWHHAEITLDNVTYSGQMMRLYVLWKNDGSVQNYCPAAIDNVCIQSCQPCDQPVVTVTPQSVILCQGESVTFTASATGGSGGGYTYSWTPAGTIVPTTGPTVTATPTQTTTYSVRVVDGEGCAKTVRVVAEVSGTRLNLQATPAGFCAGSSEPVVVTAQLQVEGSCSSYTYLWNTGATGTSINVTPTVTTEYTVTATPTDPSCCELVASTVVAVMDCSAEGCPSVAPAELGTNNVDIYIDCATQPEVTLSANVMATAVEADDYFVFQIPYNPPYGYTAGNRIFADASDDTWSSVVNLPFAFCYYGNTYTQIVAGANSVATFDVSQAGNYCDWSYDDAIPSTNLLNNTIFAAYRDIYPSVSDYVASTGDGGIFEGVLGEYPCRSYVLSFNNIKLFSCTSVRTFTSMIVLYEGTNVIDIYIRDAPTCLDWNDGNGLIGLQNADGTRGITPPNRNTGPWTAHNEAWRFMPTGQPNYTVTWYAGPDTTGTPVGYGELLTVAPTETTSYTARLQYTACNGDYFDLMNTCRITVNSETPPLRITVSKDTLCPEEDVTVTAVTDDAVSYLWNTGDTVQQFTRVPDSVITTYAVTVTFDNGCTRSDSVTVYAVASIDPPTFEVRESEICSGDRVVITANDYARYQWSTGAYEQSIVVYPNVTTTYSLTVSDEVGCSSSAEVQVIVHPMPVASFAPGQYLTFLENGVAPVHFIDFSENTFSWMWDFGDQWSSANTSTDQEPDHDYTHSGIYTVTQWVTSDFGCMDSTSHQVSIQKPFYFYVPNAFSPDGDGINEVWRPVGEGVNERDYVCCVYDRFGKLVFRSTNLLQGWDGTEAGKPLPLGSYIYVIQTSTMDDIPKEFVGTVTIIR